MSSAPLVSVVIPTFCRAKYLAETLDSVLGQTCRDLEVIVVEDGSHEAEEIVASHDGPVTYLWQPNQGVGIARNTGAARARGEWLAFMDDDDLWKPEKVERQLAAAARSPEVALLHTDHLTLADGVLRVPPRTPPRGAVPSGWVSAALILNNFIITSSVIVRKAEFDRVGGFTPHRDWAEDLDLWLRLSRECQIGFVPEPLTIYRDHSDSLSSDLRWHLCRANVLEQFVRSSPSAWGELGGARLRQRMRNMYWMGAYDHFMGEEYATAARLFARAWRWQPWRLRPLVYGAACLTGAPGLRILRRLKRGLT